MASDLIMPQDTLSMNDEAFTGAVPTAGLGDTSVNNEEASRNEKAAREYTLYKKSILIGCFSRLVQFIKSLLAVERPHSKFNPIRVQLAKLCTEAPTKSEEALALATASASARNVYMKFLYDCVKYCNKAEGQSLDAEELAAVGMPPNAGILQLEIYGLIEALLK